MTAPTTTARRVLKGSLSYQAGKGTLECACEDFYSNRNRFASHHLIPFRFFIARNLTASSRVANPLDPSTVVELAGLPDPQPPL